MNTEQTERKKYQRVWSEIPEYGNYSPADSMSIFLINLFKRMNVLSILDAGVGSGKAMDKMIQAGFKVKGIDITLRGLINRSLTEHCIEATLWDIPLKEPSDVVMCIDVMEHIPPHKVDNVLEELSRLCKGFAVFQIALNKDGYGKKINDTLHMSLFTVQEWTARLRKQFRSVNAYGTTESCVTFYCYNAVIKNG